LGDGGGKSNAETASVSAVSGHVETYEVLPKDPWKGPPLQALYDRIAKGVGGEVEKPFMGGKVGVGVNNGQGGQWGTRFIEDCIGKRRPQKGRNRGTTSTDEKEPKEKLVPA